MLLMTCSISFGDDVDDLITAISKERASAGSTITSYSNYVTELEYDNKRLKRRLFWSNLEKALYIIISLGIIGKAVVGKN